MKITILHNELERYTGDKSGFSLLIEINSKKILFDVSYSNDIIENSNKAGIKLNNIDYLVLSHGHIDHTEGLKFIEFSNVKNLLAHPDCFQKKYFEGEEEIGCPIALDELKQKTNVILSKKPYWIEKDKIVFLGQIPRNINFEAKESIGYLENKKDDFVLDDSAIAITTDKGLVIISGCSHAGICNIIAYAKQVCKENKIYLLLGGFHLFNKKITDKTIEFIKKQKIEHTYPAHCLDDYAFSEFKKIGGKRIHTLQKIEF